MDRRFSPGVPWPAGSSDAGGAQSACRRDLTARMQLAEGPAALLAPSGSYNIEDQLITVDGLVRFATSDGYRMQVRNVAIDLPHRSLIGSGGVEGAVPAGSFSANAIHADLDERVIALVGNARLRMVPGQLRMP